MVATLVLLLAVSAVEPAVPPGWKLVRDKGGACQIAVPPEWTPLEESSGAAVLRDASTGIAAVTSQPGQPFRPLTESLLRLLGVPKERLFENSAKRVFYQDKVGRNAEDPDGYSASVPSRGGTCSCRVAVVRAIPAATAKAIALSLAPVPADTGEKPQMRTSR